MAALGALASVVVVACGSTAPGSECAPGADAGPRDGGPRDAGSRDASPRDATRDGATRDGVARDGSARDASPCDGAARDGALCARDGAARDGAADGEATLRPRGRRSAAHGAPTGRDEARLAQVLATAALVAAERGHGGRSLSFRVLLDGGASAYFKPEQSFSGMHWYAEIAAYHLDRALGLGRAPVVVGRRIPWSALAGAAGDDPRVPEIVVGEDGTVRGAMVEWIDERLVPLRAPPGLERWLGEAIPGITPFQSPRAWHEARERERRGVLDAGAPPEPPPPDTDDRPAELSDLVVFDFLVHNADRWSESSTNVRTRGPGGPLVFLDQAAGFSARRARLTLLDERLAAVQRFRRTTVDAVRALDADPLAPILDEVQLAHLAERREALLAHVDALVAERGESAVYVW